MDQTIIDDGFASGRDLALNGIIKDYLATTSKWAKFLAIVGFVMCGLFVLMGLFAGTFFGYMFAGAGMMEAGLPMGLFTFIYLASAALWFMPLLYLYRFATATQRALRTNSQEDLITSFQNLKSHYKFIGILVAITLGFYALMILIALITGLLM